MKITLYNVISQDGFVATKDSKEDFIPDVLWDLFIEACNENDTLVWGKNTYEAFKQYDQELIEKFNSLPIKKIILSRDKDFIPESPFTVAHSVEEISHAGEKILVSGSATLNDLFIHAKMVDEVIVNILPVTIGEGIPQFGTQPVLELVSELQGPKWLHKVYKVI